MSTHKLLSFNVTHARYGSKPYKFVHRFFWFKLDLLKLDQDRPWGVSYNKWGIYSFWDKDHLLFDQINLKDACIAFARLNGVNTRFKEISLYSHLRFLGYVFNPVSFILMKDENQQQYAIIEIGNTFDEKKPYFVSSSCFEGDSFKIKVNKFFYISPFIEHDNALTFKFDKKGEEISISVMDEGRSGKILDVFLKGLEQDLSVLNLFKETCVTPLVTIKTIFLIHWHALVLWLKGIKYFKKNENQHLQQGYYKWKT